MPGLPEAMMAGKGYEARGRALGRLLDEKNAAYGDSMLVAPLVLAAIFPDGVAPDQYHLMLAFARIIDKMNRMASDPGYGGEDPALDLAGYGLLLSAEDRAGLSERVTRTAEIARGAHAGVMGGHNSDERGRARDCGGY